MSNLENLRKQAKRYLRWHRQGHVPVAARIRSVLPAYAGLTDREILGSPFKLSDAQALVALEEGFEDWPALIEGQPSMTASATPSAAPFITGAEPQVFVSDMATALAFYQQQLGFGLAFAYGDPPFYAQVFRDDARLNLRWVEGPVFDAGFRSRNEDALSAALTLADAKPLFLEYQAAGLAFHQPLRTQPWGARTFIVADPDGNLILFAGAG